MGVKDIASLFSRTELEPMDQSFSGSELDSGYISNKVINGVCCFAKRLIFYPLKFSGRGRNAIAGISEVYGRKCPSSPRF